MKMRSSVNKFKRIATVSRRFAGRQLHSASHRPHAIAIAVPLVANESDFKVFIEPSTHSKFIVFVQGSMSKVLFLGASIVLGMSISNREANCDGAENDKSKDVPPAATAAAAAWGRDQNRE